MKYLKSFLAILFIGIGAVGCEILSNQEDESPVSALPWPEHQGIPECEPFPGGFEFPSVSAEIGTVHVTLSGDMVAGGERELVTIVVGTTDSTNESVTPDPDAMGTVTLSVNGESVTDEAVPILNGRGEGVAVFKDTGSFRLKAIFTRIGGEIREGERDIVVYDTKLPIFEMAIEDADWEVMMATPDERIKVPAVLTVDGVEYETEVRIHGGSSRSYPKKSFRFDLGKGLALPDTHDHLILRAEWNDKSLLRNYLGLELFRNGTWLPTPLARMVHFRVNDRFYGVMWHVERIGGDFLRVRGLNHTTCSLYEADPDSSCWMPGGNLTPLGELESYRCVYDLKKGPPDYSDLIEFIDTTLQLDDDAFRDTIGDVLDLDAYFVYLAAMVVVGNFDHIKKNYYMYRDPDAEDDRWIFLPWDLELTFGHLWTAENDVLDEGVYYDMSPEFIDYRNRLIDKLFVHPAFLVRYYDILDHILHETFTKAFIAQRVEYIVCMGTPDILADTNKRATNDEYPTRVEEIAEYVRKRRTFLTETE